MVDRAAPRAADPPSVRRCPFRRQGDIQRCSAPAVSDRLAPTRSAGPPAARQRPRPDAEIDGGEVSWHPPIEVFVTRPARLKTKPGGMEELCLSGLATWRGGRAIRSADHR